MHQNAQEELINSRFFLDSVFESSPLSMWISDENGTLLRMNDACRQTLDITDAEVVGKYNLFNDPILKEQGYLPMIKDVFEKKSIAHFITTYDTGEGKELTLPKTRMLVLDVHISPIVDQQGKVTHAIIQHIDITEKRKNHNALKFREEKFINLIKNLNIAVLFHGPETEVLDVNSKALELFGVTEEQLLGKTSFDQEGNVIHEDGTPFPGSTHPVPVAIATQKPVKDVIMGVYRPKTKDRIWLSVSAEPELTKNGTVRQVICTYKDITESIHLKETLIQSKRFSQSLVDMLSSKISIIDETGLILAVNSEWRRSAEMDSKSCVTVCEGVNYLEICDATFGSDAIYAKAMAAGIRSVIQGGQPSFSLEYPCHSPSEKRWFNAIVTRLDNYIPTRVVIEHKNVTELKEVLRLNTELRQLSNHLQNVSEEGRSLIANEIHNDFAQNLIALTMNAAYLKSKTKDHDEIYQEKLEEQIEIAGGLINTSRTLFNLLHPMILDELGLDAAVRSYAKTKLKQSGIQFSIRSNIAEDKLSKELNLELYRIFEECVTNVLLHSKATKISVAITKNDQTVAMTIEDNGDGFDESKVDTTLHHGLLEIRERVYAMKGEFTINSIIGEGVLLKVKVPFQQTNYTFP